MPKGAEDDVCFECDDCGEVFDEAEIAYNHTHDPMVDARFILKLRRDAF